MVNAELIRVTLLKDQEFIETDGPWPGWPMVSRASMLRAGQSVEINRRDAERMIDEEIAEKE